MTDTVTQFTIAYRPKTLDEMIGQENIVKILKQQLLTNNIKNCYLFCGTSGCGKTTAGKAFANLINKNKPLINIIHLAGYNKSPNPIYA